VAVPVSYVIYRSLIRRTLYPSCPPVAVKNGRYVIVHHLANGYQNRLPRVESTMDRCRGNVMKKIILAVLLCTSAEAGCVETPPLSEATGSTQSYITIRDVVNRVKCELSDAFDEKISQPDFLWLASWTAHTDLTLTINDNAGVSPSGSFTTYQQNAVNQAAGPSTFPPTVARGVVNQFFTVSVGAALSGQAIRTETLSFTIALNELKLWREHQDKIEADPNFPPQMKLCNFGVASGVTGNLGLNEWVDSAFFPVVGQQLQAGIHSAGAAKAASPSAPQPAPAGPPKAAAEKLTVGAALDQIKEWQATLSTLQAKTKSASAAIDRGKTSIPKAKNTIKQEFKAKEPYNSVLAPYLKQRYAQVSVFINQYSKDLMTCQQLQKDLTSAELTALWLYDSLKDVTDQTLFVTAVSGLDLKAFGANYNKLDDQIKSYEVDEHGQPSTIANGQFARAMNKCAQIVQAAQALPSKLPQHVDPPIDSVLHSLTFVISYGANITPNWTLIQWKGPGQNGSLLSASGLRTHLLVISMGPRSGEPAIGPDPLRLITLQAIRAINGQ
jgi:hypothetical protein